MGRPSTKTARRVRAGVLLAAAVTGLSLQIPDAFARSVTRTTAFDYDAAGQLVKEVVEPADSTLCVVSSHALDQFGNRTSTTQRNCNGTAGQYSGSGPGVNNEAPAPAATSKAVFESRATSQAFDASGRYVDSRTNALDHKETYAHNKRFGVIESLTGPNQLTTRWAYDDFGRKALEERSDGTGTRIRYEYCYGLPGDGVVATASCPTVESVAPAYVVTETPVKQANALQNSDGGAIGPYKRTYYDVFGRALRTEAQSFDANTSGVAVTPRILVEDVRYNSLGQLTHKTLPYYSGATEVLWAEFIYDKVGRVVEERAPDLSKRLVAYEGLKTIYTNDKGQKRTELRNEAGQLISVTDNRAKTLTFTYEPTGNVEQTTDSQGNFTKLTYDVKGRKLSSKDPNMGTWSYSYNALGELRTQTDAKLKLTEFTYDKLGRQLTRVEGTQNAAWFYEKLADGRVCGLSIGRLCETQSSNGYKRQHLYDSLGRVILTGVYLASPNPYTIGTEYVTDAASADVGRVRSVTYPSGLKVGYSYSPMGYLLKVTAADQLVWRLENMDEWGNVTQQTYGNNITTLAGHDRKTGRLTNLLSGHPTYGAFVMSHSYDYDTIGNLKGFADASTGQRAVYEYDELNRLKVEYRVGTDVAQPVAISWGYDDVGNVTSRSDVGTFQYPTPGAGVVRPYGITGVVGTVNGVASPSYGYDANGNLQSTAGRTVTWTSFNKVEKITGTFGGQARSVQYLYGAEHMRVAEFVTRAGAATKNTFYIQPGPSNDPFYEEETDVAAGNQIRKKHYIHAGGAVVAVVTNTLQTQAWDVQYWHRDRLGSTVAITNSVGGVVERMAYEPFGKRRQVGGYTDLTGALAPVSTERGFTGHEMIDEFGLVNMNGRIYDPAIGRFLSADPIIQAPDNMQSHNRYAYIWNNPLAAADPSGYCFMGCFWHGSNLAEPFRDAGKALAKVVRDIPLPPQVKQVVLTVGCTVATGGNAPGCAAAAAVIVAKSYGASDWSALKSGGIAYATAWGFEQVGTAYRANGEAWYIKVGGHALVGCGSAAASGGDCGKGALSAGLTAGYTHLTNGGMFYENGNTFDRYVLGTIEHGLIGGTISASIGGDFNDGAQTAAYGYLFNQLGNDLTREMHNERIMAGRGCSPQFANACAGIKAGSPEAVASARKMDGYIAFGADKMSSGLALASAFPGNPFAIHTGAAAIFLKSVSYTFSPPSAGQVAVDLITVPLPFVAAGMRIPEANRAAFDYTVSLGTDLVGPRAVSFMDGVLGGQGK